MFFDFHHHHPHIEAGIYNLPIFGEPKNYPFSAGIHPKDNITESSEQWDWLKAVSQNKNCLAIGECGLDGMIDVPRIAQIESFKRQISWANEIRKPLIIHCVRMFSEILPYRKESQLPMIIHGFNKKQNIAEDLLKHNFYLSFGKALLYNLSLQKTLEIVPLNRLFIETDDSNTPIEELYEKVSSLKKTSMEDLKNVISENLEHIKNG